MGGGEERWKGRAGVGAARRPIPTTAAEAVSVGGGEDGRDEQAWGRPVAVAGQRYIRLRRGKGRAGVGAARLRQAGAVMGRVVCGRTGTAGCSRADE